MPDKQTKSTQSVWRQHSHYQQMNRDKARSPETLKKNKEEKVKNGNNDVM